MTQYDSKKEINVPRLHRHCLNRSHRCVSSNRVIPGNGALLWNNGRKKRYFLIPFILLVHSSLSLSQQELSFYKHFSSDEDDTPFSTIRELVNYIADLD